MIEETSNPDFEAERSMQNSEEHLQDFNPAEDTQSDLEKLEKYSGDVDWSYLKPHYDSGSMVYVDPELDLQTAGLAFTNDEKEKVSAWLKTGHLVQPCDLHVEHWIESKTTFNAMIVRPFVLAQPIQ